MTGTLNSLLRATCAVALGPILLLALTIQALAGASQLVSVRNPSLPLAVPGNGSSAGPIITPDGRFVAFVSTANDLTPGGNNQFMANVFLRDRLLNITVLVSTNINGTGGGNGSSILDGISPDGRFILFESDASDLVAGDANGVTDIFMRDVLTGTTTLVSVSTDGGPANGASSKPVMTPDGRYVAFISLANNLVFNDVNGISDVFVRDLVGGTTTLASPGATIVSAGANNVMDTPVITPDGRFVAFVSSAKNLVGGMTTWPGDIFVRDLLSNTTTWLSTNNSGSNYSSSDPVISSDGRFVAFKQRVSGTSNAFVFRYDALAGANVEIDTNNAGLSQTNGVAVSFVDDAMGPVMTPDGRYVFYVQSSNSVPTAIYQWDGQVLSNTPVSLNMSGTVSSNATSHTPIITDDGRYLAFLSSATDIVTNTVTNGYHLYLRDLQLGTNYLVDADTNGVGSTDITGAVPSISSDGRYVSFASLDAGFVASDNNLALDVFLRDTTNGTTELISARNTGVVSQSGSGISSMSQSAITPDGRWLVFASRADDLVTNDFNNDQDVFVRDLLIGTNILVSVGTDGNAALGGWSAYPVISADGRYVSFLSNTTNLLAGGTSNIAAIYERDLQAGTTVQVNVNSNGTLYVNSDSSSAPVMSQDGRYVAFVGNTNASPPPPAACILRRDVFSNQTLTVTNSASPFQPAMSADGRYVGFVNFNNNLWVEDTLIQKLIYSNTLALSPGKVAFSPSGAKMLYITGPITVVDLVSRSNILSIPATVVTTTPVWSANGRFFAFVTKAAEGSGDNNGVNDVFLCDLVTSNINLVSLNGGHTGAANDVSDQPSISGDGRFIAYRSFATDIVPGLTNTPNIFVFDRMTGSNSLLSVETGPASYWSTSTGRASISGDGGVVAFQSMRPNLTVASSDLNRVQDVFSQPQSPLSFADSDADGIPDWWLNQYFGHPNGSVGDLSRAQDDADGDGMSNLQEYLTGTDPKNASSVFKLQIAPVIASTNVTLTWPSVPGKSYRVQFKNQLADPLWSDIVTNIYVGSSQVSLTVPAIVSSRYYRVLAVN